MKVIPAPVSTPDSTIAHPADAGLRPADDSNSPSFEDLLRGAPDRTTDKKEERDLEPTHAESDQKDATDSALQAVLQVPLPAQQPLPVQVPPSVPAGCMIEDGLVNQTLPGLLDSDEGGLGVAESSSQAGSGEIGAATLSANAAPFAATQPKPLGLAGKNLPAKFAVTAADATPQGRVEEAQTESTPSEIKGEGPDGTAVATQRRAMPEHLIDHHLKLTSSVETPREEASALAGVSRLHENSGTPRKIEPAQISTVPFAEIAPSSPTAGEFSVRTGNVKPAELHAAARFVEQTMDIAERINAKDSDHVEVQMRLLDGQEVSVSLHLENGAWKPVFKTGTDALCKALEQGWQQAAAQPADRLVRFGTPVFESLQSQAGLGGGMQQQPNARERSFAQREQESLAPPLPRRNRGAAAPAVSEYLAASSGVRLYA